MNDTRGFSTPPEPVGSTAGTQLREMWETRPHRTPGKLGGVAAGIGARYDLDPVLIRVAFGVATVLGGSGIPLYLACWLLLPAAGDDVSAGESLMRRGRASMSRRGAIILAILLAITGSSLLSTNVWGLDGVPSGMLGLLALGLGAYYLHRRRPAPAAAPAVPVSLTKHDVSTPPRWDPLGAAPFAWDLPEPAPAPTPRRPRSRHTPVTLGLALLAAAAAIAIRLATGWAWLDAGVIGAVALAVIGAGLVVGAFRRRGYGLLAVAAPLIGFVVIAAAASDIDFGAGLGDRDIRVLEQSQLQPRYDGGIGDLTLDLTELRLAEDDSVEVKVGVGDVTVLLPDSLNVNVTCTSGLGDVACTSGVSTESARTLTLTVDGGVGDVEVRRG